MPQGKEKMPFYYQLWFIILILCSGVGTLPAIVLYSTRLIRYPRKRKQAFIVFGLLLAIVIIAIRSEFSHNLMSKSIDSMQITAETTFNKITGGETGSNDSSGTFTIQHPNDFRIGSKVFSLGNITPADIQEEYDVVKNAVGTLAVYLESGNVAFECDDTGMICKVGANSAEFVGYNNIRVEQSRDKIYGELGKSADHTSYYEAWFFSRNGKSLSLHDAITVLLSSNDEILYTISIYFNGDKATAITVERMRASDYSG